MTAVSHGLVLGMRVDATSYAEATKLVLDWASQGESRYVCVANVHMVMEAYDDLAFQAIVNAAALVTPDGMPLVWMLRRLGFPAQERVRGPDLMLRVCEASSALGVPIGLYGGHPDALSGLRTRLCQAFPELRVVYAYSPPFRPPTPDEDERVVEMVEKSGARILFVGLGCPKQEWWMAEHLGRIPAVMLGVGAAFDLHSGRRRQAPLWMQRRGLEWLFRLVQEPGRLWSRYAKHNPRFAVLALRELWRHRRGF